MAFALPWLHVHPAAGTPTYGWSAPEPTVAMYALVAAVCVFLAWWGVRQSSKAIVNYGIAAFALTVMWFYFSDIMGKLDRSLGLILLGVLFLAGGWALEKARRRLVAQIGVDRMSRTLRAVALLVAQALLVLSIAGKYLYERKACPRVWVRSAQYDPNLPLRGRYLSLHSGRCLRPAAR